MANSDEKVCGGVTFCLVCGFPLEDKYKIVNGENSTIFYQQLLKARRETFINISNPDEFQSQYFSADLEELRIGASKYDIDESSIVLSAADGCASMIFTIRLSKESRLSFNEIGKVISLFRNKYSPAKIIKTDRTKFESIHGIKALMNFLFKNIRLRNIGRGISDYAVIYPICYIENILGCHDASDILAQHKRNLAAASNGWFVDEPFLKASEINARCKDCHPFDYGVTVISPYSTIEAHPANVAEIANREGHSEEAHHLQELAYLIVLPEYVCMHLSRSYAIEIAMNAMILKFATISKYKLLFISLFDYYSMMELRRKAMHVIGEGRKRKTLRKDYTANILYTYEDILSLPEEIDRIETQMNHSNFIISNAQQSVLAMSSFILAMLAIIFSAIQIIN